MRLLFFNLILFLLSGKFICKTVKSEFNHCNNKFCEEIEEIEVVQYFDKCTEYPYVKFISKHLGKMMDGFLNQKGDLITEPQVEIPCNRKVKPDNYRDFSIESDQPQIHSTLHSQHIPNHHSQNQPVVQSTSQNLHQQSQTNSHTQPLHSTNQLHSQTNSHIQPHIQPQIQSQIQQHTQPHHSTNQLQSPTHSYIQPNTQTYHSINQLQSPSLSSNILQPMLNQGQPITPIRQGSVLIPAYDTLPSFQPSPHIPMNRSPPFSPIRMETNGGKSPCPLCPSRYQTEKGIKQHCRMTHPQYELTLKNRLWGYIFRGQ
jgi:hypothetical protein